MARMPLPAPTLHTARLRLRPFDDADANDLFALHSNAYVMRYWDAPPWSERVRAGRFITACRQMAQEGTGARLAVDRVSGDPFIGWCSLNRWNPDYRSASLGYCFDDAAWGHGYATEAAHVLLRWAFDTLDLNRVQAETDTRNVASADGPADKRMLTSSFGTKGQRPKPAPICIWLTSASMSARSPAASGCSTSESTPAICSSARPASFASVNSAISVTSLPRRSPSRMRRPRRSRAISS
jgi:[ribosomal protein S5]-alanine N-acetyltransferase